MKRDASYWRARLDTIMQLITEEKGGDRTVKNNHSVLLRNGVIPDGMKDRYEAAFKEHLKARKEDGQPLSFAEITRFNTWFEIHPKKVAGKETVTTSRDFPISIKGSESTILTTIDRTLGSRADDRVRIARAKAEAKLKLLQLLKV